MRTAIVMRAALVFKGHSLGGTSIASLQVSKKCTVEFTHAGRAARWALPHCDDTTLRILYVIKTCVVLSVTKNRIDQIPYVSLCPT